MPGKSTEMNSRGCLYCCMCLTRWIPVVFIVALLGWSYYAYAIELCFFQIDNLVKRSFYFIFYHVLLLLFAWAYFKTIFTPVKKPPEDFYLLETDVYQMATAASEQDAKAVLERKSKDLPILTRTNNGAVRYCDKCKCIKPDRSHHCSVCQTCVLKMDHHCPWVNNCVGYSNYKFFLLFLGYSTTYCLYIAATSLEYFIRFWADLQNIKPSRFHILFLFFVSIMFAISISSLFFYHIYLTARNCTTLESFRPPVFASTMLADKHGFDLGRRENFKQIFGSNILKAFLPLFTSSTDGLRFARRVPKSETTEKMPPPDVVELPVKHSVSPVATSRSKITILVTGDSHSSRTIRPSSSAEKLAPEILADLVNSSLPAQPAPPMEPTSGDQSQSLTNSSSSPASGVGSQSSVNNMALPRNNVTIVYKKRFSTITVRSGDLSIY